MKRSLKYPTHDIIRNTVLIGKPTRPRVGLRELRAQELPPLVGLVGIHGKMEPGAGESSKGVRDRVEDAVGAANGVERGTPLDWRQTVADHGAGCLTLPIHEGN